MDWEIKEWLTELKANDVAMKELHVNKQSEKLEQQQNETKEAEERKAIEFRAIEAELRAERKALEKRELELQRQAALLDIAICVTELNIANRFGDFEKRFDDLEREVLRRRRSNLNSGETSSTQMNRMCDDDESSSQSEDSN